MIRRKDFKMTLRTKMNKLNSVLEDEAFSRTWDAILQDIAEDIANVWYNGGKVIVAGNGGSASQAEHFSAELLGRFKAEKAPIPVVCLNSNMAAITAIANDYGYEKIFSKQLDALGEEQDILILFSTSGHSPNILKAAVMGDFIGATVISFTGASPSNELVTYSDQNIRVDSVETDVIQEAHMIFIHTICEYLEAER